ncbi:MarR family winged helix-turn-helix transcriptional regulator [Tropicibacter naphthalenivorans]|uniref:Putative HTH-type transcriptional regulator YusO n=1 Tax=Tropicibacter naphthalenivorans TaxID=441103 RepID=A0A0P1GHY0_9RHOB|nr:MarR family transcriptional regulator [Tropicibacter naphthalenivorans]CUH81239.1 putative HTH-type transcriptional regulator YusO [Tropicibacter naphthalenivorans]SMC97872.1 DNA-binding transcriptional regulator, MarR family [Tropicibacter naphthalenivorans]
MPQRPFELAEFLPYRMTVAAERLSAGMARRYRDEFGISVAEWRVLVHVADAGAVSIRDIHSRVHLEKSKASRAATRLEAAGYVTKTVNETDRRLISLTLTDQGQALMQDLTQIARDYQARLDALLAPQLDALNAALDTLETQDL